jgi:hypothetical protein
MDKFNETIFVKNKKYERGCRLKVKVHILFYGDNSRTIAVENEVWYSRRSWTYLQVLFYSLFCLNKLLNMAMVRNFEVMLG